MDRGLSFLLLVAHLSLVDCAHVLVEVPLVKPLDVLNGIFSGIELLAKFLHLKLPRLNQIVAVLSLLIELNHSTAQTVKILKHNEPLDIGECLLSTIVKGLRCICITESRSDDVLNAL